MVKRRFFVYIITFVAIILPRIAMGQNALQVEEIASLRKSVQLGGKAEVIFVSKSEHLIIESSRPSLDTRLAPKKNRSGEWEYVIQLQLNYAKERTFTITESGTTDQVVVPKKVFVGNNQYFYNVKRNENVIFLVNNSQPNDAHMVNGEAAIEPNKQLPCKVISSTNEAGFYSTTVIIDMWKYGELKSNITLNTQRYEQYNETLLSRAEKGESVSNQEWDSLSHWQEQLETAEAEFLDISTINISQEKSNTVQINVSRIGPKQKLTYVVNRTASVKTPKSHTPKRWFVMANYAFSPNPQHSFGITGGLVGKYGVYVSISTNGNFLFSPDHEADDEQTNSYLWSGETATTRFSVTAGGMFSVGNFGYLYAGLGYGIRNKIWYTLNEESVSLLEGQYNGLMLEAGVTATIADHFLLSAGAALQIPKTYFEFKFGVGYRF